MSIMLKRARVGAAMAALALGATVTASSAFAATRVPVSGSEASPYYAYEGGYSYTDPDGMYGNHGDPADDSARSSLAYDPQGNCIGWKCDF